MQELIDRAKWLLKSVDHAAMATVNEDGSPHNSPYLFMANNDLSELYWGSHPNSVHSKNILRTGELFVVLYEANERGGLYIKCKNGRIAEDEELQRALKRHNEIRAARGKDELPESYYLEPSEQRMWICDTVQFWVNTAERDSNNLVREDVRLETPRNLLAR